MLTRTTTIIREETLWIPELHITGSEWNREAFIVIPVSSGNQQLEAFTARYKWEDFNEFYANYTNDKYLVQCVLEQNAIELEAPDITDITN